MRLLDLKVGDIVQLPTPYKPEPILAGMRRRWRAAIIEPGRENATLRRLQDLDLNLNPYLPLIHKLIPAGRRRKREIDTAMFPAYIFIPMPDSDEIWHEVLATRGVQGFLSDADRRPKELAPIAIEAVRLKERELDAKRLQRLAATGNYPLEIGARVWVPDLLPFQALLARIEGYDARGRAEVVLELEVLGRRHFAIAPHRLRTTDD